MASMGKTIIVKIFALCSNCRAYKKLGCYLMSCSNKLELKDNSIPNELIYKEREIQRQGVRFWNVKNVVSKEPEK